MFKQGSGAGAGVEEPKFGHFCWSRSQTGIFQNWPQLQNLNQGKTFAPLPVETFGSWHNAAADHIKRLGKALGRNTGQDEGDTTMHLFQRLSLLLVRGNVSLLINRIPDFPGAEVDGITQGGGGIGVKFATKCTRSYDHLYQLFV